MQQKELTIRAIVLAAGKGTRMHTEQAKVLAPLLDRPILAYVLDALKEAGIEDILLIVGHQAQAVMDAFPGFSYALQQPQLGTGHAVMQAQEFADLPGLTLVINGDGPLITAHTLKKLIEKAQGQAMSILSTRHPQPAGYGRIIRDEQGNFVSIVEARDCTPQQLAIDEINSGIYCFDNQDLFRALNSLKADNAQHEYYLTDVAAILKEQGKPIQALDLASSDELLGINDARDLEQAFKALQKRINKGWLEKGVFMENSEQTVIGKDVRFEPGVRIQAPARLTGTCRVEAEVLIGFGSDLHNVILKKGASTRCCSLRDCTIPEGERVLGVYREEPHD